MAEFDLIPNDYRERLWRERRLREFVLIAVGLLLLSGGVAAALNQVKNSLQKEVEQLQAQRAISTQQTAELKSLRKQKAEFEYQWSLLEGLRGGMSAEHVFYVIDGALDGHDVWFSDWKFRRAGVKVSTAQQAEVKGYFLVLPKGQQNAKEDAWQIETDMTIKGQAVDYTALANFVRALFSKPEIHDVRVLKTILNHSHQPPVIDFDLAVVVNAAFGNG